jgi:hypothetical protein
MWPFSLLKRLFGGPDEDSLESKLAEFVSAEHRRADQPAAQPRTTSRDMLALARRTVDGISSNFEAYVTDKVVRKHPKDFKLERPGAAQTRDMDEKFGDSKTGNEYRYVKVAFRDRYVIGLRVQAIILSRDLQLKTVYFEPKGTTPPYVQEIDLSPWPSLTDVTWDKVFNKIVLDFLDWHKSIGGKS